MWTGLFPHNRFGQPVVYGSIASARKALARFPSWGHAAVEIRTCKTRMGSNGRRDYFIGDVVARGLGDA